MSFSLNLGLFRAIFGRKIRSQKLGKSKANPNPKMPIFGRKWPFSEKFFSTKNVSKWLKVKGNKLKCHFLLIYFFLGHFLVKKLGVKNWPKVRLTTYQNANFWPKLAIF